MDFTRAQAPKVNPWAYKNGISPMVGSFYGLGVLPALNATRGDVAFVWNPETMEVEEADGFDVCFPEVAPWPYEEDEAGVPFDQSSIYGVRTRCWRRPLADGGGDKEWYVPVPKSLPAEYTAVGRSNLIYIFGDFIGGDPLVGMTPWVHRTANGFIPDITTDEGLARSVWYPMGFNDRTLSVGYSAGLIGDGPDDFYKVSALVSTHVGFRGGRVTADIINPGGPYPRTVTQEYTIGCMPLTQEWISGSPGANDVEDLVSFTLTHTFANISSPTNHQQFQLDPAIPDEVGIAKRFIVYSGPYTTATATNLVTATITLEMSPRTDVPLPFFCSQQNRCAPGGIILP